MAWFSLAKVALQAGTHIFKKRQETKMMMADAQHHHAAKMARGETEYQGKLLEASLSNINSSELTQFPCVACIVFVLLQSSVCSNNRLCSLTGPPRYNLSTAPL